MTIEDKFCYTKNEEITFSNTPIKVTLPTGNTIKRQSLHLGDINIDGYPDLFLILVNKNNEVEIPMLYENQFDTGDGSFYPF